MMTKAMQGLGRWVAVAGVSAGVGAVLGALGIAGYRRRNSWPTRAAMNDIDARLEAIKMDETPSTFAAGDEVGGDVIGDSDDGIFTEAISYETTENVADAIAADALATEIAINGLVESDSANEVAEGNYRAADGLHTEEAPRTKGPKGKRSPNGARTRKNLNGHN